MKEGKKKEKKKENRCLCAEGLTVKPDRLTWNSPHSANSK